MDWPVYFKERLTLINPKEGFVGVATLWTPKDKIIFLLPQNVAVAGQLYTKAGIEFIIRNLWANPQVSCLVIWGNDLTGSGKALVEFFKKGTIDNEIPFTESQIPAKNLMVFRKKVRLVDLRKLNDPKKAALKISKIKSRPLFAQKAKIFSQPPPASTFPSETSVFRIEAATVGLAWLQILKTVVKFGWKVPKISVYGGEERMVLNLCVVITEENIKTPKIYPFFTFNKREIKRYFKGFFKPDRDEYSYTYGERIFGYLGIDQLKIMVRKLQSFPYNKGALAVLWQPTIDNFPVRKPWTTPCLTLIQGICQPVGAGKEDKLHLTVYIRSNDMFSAWPLNAFALRKLQTVLAMKIGKKVGALTTISQSAFIDTNNLAAAEKIVKENDRLFCSWDPRGNLSISVVRQQIVVRHFSPDGRFLQEFKIDGRLPKAAQKMGEMLLKAQVISQVGHALDIGEQLGRAEEAIKLGLKFEQDRNLDEVKNKC